MNLSKDMEGYLPRAALEVVWRISKGASQCGERVYLVGGVARDLLLGRPNFDLDLVIEGDAIALAQQIAELFSVRTSVYSKFGTAKLNFGSFTIDLAMARNESYTKPGALPDVSPGTLEEDLFRRDFSINAMAISLVPDSYGELVDPCHGLKDLRRRVIRILHHESFCDDATRIWRAIRYEQRLNFKLERETSRSLKENVAMLNTISNDRIRHELNLILREEYPERTLCRLSELHALPEINLSLEERAWLARKFQEARFQYKAGSLAQLYLCLLIYPLTQEGLTRVLHRFNMHGRRAQILRETLNLKANIFLLEGQMLKRSEIYHLLKNYPQVVLQAGAIASDVEAIRSRLNLFLSELRLVAICSTGDDLVRLGIPPGLEMGEILEQLLDAKLDGKVKTLVEEEELATELKTTRAGTLRARHRKSRI